MDWVTHLITALISGGTVGAIFAGYLKLTNAWHEQRRQVRGDEIDVLHNSIAELRTDRDQLQVEVRDNRRAWDKELNKLRSEHSACLLEQERQRGENRHLQAECDWMKERLKKVEAVQNGGDGD